MIQQQIAAFTGQATATDASQSFASQLASAQAATPTATAAATTTGATDQPASRATHARSTEAACRCTATGDSPSATTKAASHPSGVPAAATAARHAGSSLRPRSGRRR